MGTGLQLLNRAMVVAVTALPNPWQSSKTLREGNRAGVHPESPARFYGAWAGPRAAGKMFTLRPGVPGSACPELLDPQVELRILADCWGTGTSGLLSHRITE